jgi:hypothetical protein
MSKWQLFSLLADADARPRHFTATTGVQYFGLLQSVARESGSGSSFNVTVANQSGSITFHLRTID